MRFRTENVVNEHGQRGIALVTVHGLGFGCNKICRRHALVQTRSQVKENRERQGRSGSGSGSVGESAHGRDALDGPNVGSLCSVKLDEGTGSWVMLHFCVMSLRRDRMKELFCMLTLIGYYRTALAQRVRWDAWST